MFLKENGCNIRVDNCQNDQKQKRIYHEFWISDFREWQKGCRNLWSFREIFHKYENRLFSYEKGTIFDVFWYDYYRWSSKNRITSLLLTMLIKDWDVLSPFVRTSRMVAYHAYKGLRLFYWPGFFKDFWRLLTMLIKDWD